MSGVLKRVAACWSVWTMPAAGVDEMLASLRDIREFRSDWPSPPLLQTEIRYGTGVSLSVRPRPELRIEDDDAD